MSTTYDPRIFLCRDEEAAMSVILTPEIGLTTEDRWHGETAWLRERLDFPEGLVIDFGCGIGRLAKVIHRNPVLGVDLSPTMRHQAESYVGRTDFGAVSPFMLRFLVEAGLRASGALAVWTLQHCLRPEGDIELLHAALQKDGVLYVVNRPERYIPSNHEGAFKWLDDGKSIDALLVSGGFRAVYCEQMPEHLCAPGATFAIYSRA